MMDKFLVKYDFQTLIDEDNLDELSNSSDRLVNDAMDSAIEKASGYLRHRYDVNKVFKVVQTFSDSDTYAIDDRIYWTETAYSASSTYSTGDLVVYNDYIYQANTDIGTPEAFNASHWDQLAEDNTFYLCIASSTGNLPTNTTYFTAGDDRNSLIKDIVVDILLYNIHSKTSPRNIPEVRHKRYDNFGNYKDGDCAINTLIQIQKGNIMLDLDVIDPVVQNTERIAYGTQDDSEYIY